MTSPNYTFERLEADLRDALPRLYDPDYVPSDALRAATGCGPDDGAGPVQSAILRLIESLEPAPDVPPRAKMSRVYQIIRHRYALRLTQEETAEQLNLSVRHLNRLQREAVHVLARALWDRSPSPAAWSAPVPGASSPQSAGEAESARTGGARPRAWRAQLREELASLGAEDGPNVARLEQTLAGALHIARTASPDHTIVLSNVPPDIQVAVHPAVLRQVLLAATGRLTEAIGARRIAWGAATHDGQVRISVACCWPQPDGLAATAASVDLALPAQLLEPYGGSVGVETDGSQLTIAAYCPLHRPLHDMLTVLAVDDNADLVSLYQSYCAGTRYQVVHVPQGRSVPTALEDTRPAAILLDVMLPDVDGWDLLLNLRADPETRGIPIVVCSVITDERLALALGASLFLRKPVWRGQLIDALDRATSQSP